MIEIINKEENTQSNELQSEKPSKEDVSDSNEEWFTLDEIKEKNKVKEKN